jgi:hypothetical protein
VGLLASGSQLSSGPVDRFTMGHDSSERRGPGRDTKGVTVIRGIETDKSNHHQPIDANSKNLTEKKDNHLLSVFIPLITVYALLMPDSARLS